MPLRIIQDGKVLISTVNVGEIIEYYEEKMRGKDLKVNGIYVSKNEEEIDATFI